MEDEWLYESINSGNCSRWGTIKGHRAPVIGMCTSKFFKLSSNGLHPWRRRSFLVRKDLLCELEELQRRNYSEITTREYLQYVTGFARHFGKSPDQLVLAQNHIANLRILLHGQ
jgi:hypothetical protein